MKYFVTFQEFGKEFSRPIDHRSHADFETDGIGLIPDVGDYVEIEPVGEAEAPRYSGRVRSRLFRYLGATCHINIVVEDNPTDDWGAVIKE